MSAREVEAFLARLYADDGMLARFLADPDAELARWSLDPGEKSALRDIDRVGLELNLTSLNRKRAGLHRTSLAQRRSWLAVISSGLARMLRR